MTGGAIHSFIWSEFGWWEATANGAVALWNNSLMSSLHCFHIFGSLVLWTEHFPVIYRTYRNSCNHGNDKEDVIIKEQQQQRCIFHCRSSSRILLLCTVESGNSQLQSKFPTFTQDNTGWCIYLTTGRSVVRYQVEWTPPPTCPPPQSYIFKSPLYLTLLFSLNREN